MKYRTIETELGPVMIAGDQDGIHFISLLDGPKGESPHADWEEDKTALSDEVEQLQSYLAGDRQDFDMALAPKGTDFQEAVWQALLTIPYGHTLSYGELAERIGKPTAARAVGAANGANPIGIVIPCHRVIGADGSLTGYGGGLQNKKTLLELEGIEV